MLAVPPSESPQAIQSECVAESEENDRLNDVVRPFASLFSVTVIVRA